MIKVIGLTGQTGAGKTSVCEILKNKGISCIDCDKISREVTLPGAPALDELKKVFGKEIINPNGELDRKKLGSLVFSDKEKLKLLNQTIFPFIIDEIRGRIAEKEKAGERLLVLDAPTLFESGCDRLCDKTVAVTADLETRKKRIITRDALSENEAQNRIASQHSDEFFKTRCDFVIKNDGDIDRLKREVDRLFVEKFV